MSKYVKQDIGIQHDIHGVPMFVAFWDFDPWEDFYYKWTSSYTLGM